MTDSKKPEKSAETAASKQMRAVVTRRQLLVSARKMFARDGFEHARIEDIALKAGKTRGAFYAHFNDKEDVFFAIFEEDLDRDQARLTPMLRALPTLEKRIQALAAYLRDLGKDRERTLLYLEFKLYAIRHPRSRKRLANLHAVMRLRCTVPEIDELLPKSERVNERERISESLAIGAVMEGLALSRLFDPEGMREERLTHYLTLCVREAIRVKHGMRGGI